MLFVITKYFLIDIYYVAGKKKKNENENEDSINTCDSYKC